MLLNLILPIFSFGIISVVGLLMAPFFVQNFGYEGLGVISNSNALVQSLFFIGGAFTTVYARLYSQSSENTERINLLNELNKILTFVSCFSLIVSMVLYLYSFNEDSSSYYYYSLIFLAASFIIVSQSFTVIPFSHNKIYINSLVDSTRALFRNLLCIAIFYVSVDDVISNAWAMVISSFLMLIALMYIYRENKFFSFGKVSFNENLKNSLWVCVNQGGAYLFSFSDVFIVNFLLGHYVGGMYALLIQIPALLKSVSVVAVGSVSSLVVKIHANNKDKFVILEAVNNIMLFFTFFISLAFIIVSSYKTLLFYIWLGDNVSSSLLNHFDTVCVVMMLLSITSIVNVFLAGWGVFVFPAKATLIAAIISMIIIIVLYLCGIVISFMMVFSIIYASLITKNIICFFVFYQHVGLGWKNILSSLGVVFFVILANYCFIFVAKMLFGDDIKGLLIMMALIIFVSMPMLILFKNLKRFS